MPKSTPRRTRAVSDAPYPLPAFFDTPAGLLEVRLYDREKPEERSGLRVFSDHFGQVAQAVANALAHRGYPQRMARDLALNPLDGEQAGQVQELVVQRVDVDTFDIPLDWIKRLKEAPVKPVKSAKEPSPRTRAGEWGDYPHQLFALRVSHGVGQAHHPEAWVPVRLAPKVRPFPKLDIDHLFDSPEAS